MEKITEEQEKNKLFDYVKLKDTTMRLHGDIYYRDGGKWGCGYIFIDGVLHSNIPDFPRLHRVKLIEITREEWYNTNRGYVSPKTIPICPKNTKK